MRNRWTHTCLVLVAGVIFVTSRSSGQAQLEELREIKLPVPTSLGSFGWEEPAKAHVAVAVAPDRTLLVLDPDANGNWLIVRVRGWWTQTPQTDVLPIAALSGGGGIACCAINVELQVTPDGRHAVAVASMLWLAPLFKHKNYVPRPRETIITIVDLEHWTVAKRMRLTAPDEIDARGARILNDHWIALQSLLPEKPTDPYAHLYDRRNFLVSIPDLDAGPQCVTTSKIAEEATILKPANGAETLRTEDRQNDVNCAALLKAGQVPSVQDLEFLTYEGHGIEPVNVLRRSLYSNDELDAKQASSVLTTEDIERLHEMYFGHWDEPDRYQMYAISPSYQSAAGNWYSLSISFGEDSTHSLLTEFDRNGKLLNEFSVAGALCDGQKDHGRNGSVCGCHIRGVSEEQHTLVAYCRTQRGDYAGTIRKEWLSVVHTDDFTNAGSVSLSNGNSEREALASVGEQAYVLLVADGQVLRVYGVGGRR